MQVDNTSGLSVFPPLLVTHLSPLLVPLVKTVPTTASAVCFLFFYHFFSLTSFFSLLLHLYLLLV